MDELRRVGDGVRDATETLQRALEAGGGLRLPAGRYRLSASLRVNLARQGPLGVLADGGATLIMAAPGPALQLLGEHRGTAQPETVTDTTAVRERMPQVAGLELVGEHPEAVGVELSGCFKPVLRDLLVRRCAIGVHLVGRNRDVIIDACHVYDNLGPGIFLDEVNLHQINIVGCHLSHNQGGGIVVFGSEVRNLQIAGCDIEYSYDRTNLTAATADVWIETRGRSVREGAIVGCTIQAMPSPGGANLRFIGESAEVAHKVGLFSITGNLISSQEVQLHLRYARGVTITGNTFFSGHQRTLVVEDSSQLVVSGNVFEHNPDYTQTTLDGIRLERVRGATLTGNQLSAILHPQGAIEVVDSREVAIGDTQVLDPAGPGVRVVGSQNVRVASTTVVDAQQPARMPHAIVFEHVAGCQLCDCRLDPGTDGAIRIVDGEVSGEAGYLNGPAR